MRKVFSVSFYGNLVHLNAVLKTLATIFATERVGARPTIFVATSTTVRIDTVEINARENSEAYFYSIYLALVLFRPSHGNRATFCGTTNYLTLY